MAGVSIVLFLCSSHLCNVQRVNCCYHYRVIVIQERDASISKQRELEREVELLKDRLEASQEGWSEARKKLEENFCRCDKKSLHHYHAFLDALSHLLTDSRNTIEPTEDHIKERIRDLLRIIRDKNEVGETREVRV